jgi:hypothetical protein
MGGLPREAEAPIEILEELKPAWWKVVLQERDGEW